jgi:hypothetical protein
MRALKTRIFLLCVLLTNAVAHSSKDADKGVVYLPRKDVDTFLQACARKDQFCGVGYALKADSEHSAKATLALVGEQLKSVVHIAVVNVKHEKDQRFEMFSPLGEPKVTTTVFETPAFETWVQKNAAPRVMELGNPKFEPHIKAAFELSGTRIVAFPISQERLAVTKEKMLAMTYAFDAPAHTNDTYLVGTCESAQSACRHFRVATDEVPAVVVDRSLVNGKKYIKRNVNTKSMQAFVERVMAGKELPELKTESLESANAYLKLPSTSAVVPLVAATWDAMMTPKLPSVVYVYSHTCPECDLFMAVYTKAAAKHAEGVHATQWFAINGVKNELPTAGFTPVGFPYLHGRFANGTFVPYVGLRSQEDLLAFAQLLESVPEDPDATGECAMSLDAGGADAAFEHDEL